jgi:hypothetical protein
MLKFAALALALAAPVMIAAPAHAADVKTLRCVEDGMNPAARASLLKDLEKNLDNAGGEQGYSPETITAIQGAAKACQAKHGWSDAATTASILYTVPKLGWPTAVRMGRAKGLNPDALAKRVRALTQDEKAQGTSEAVLGKLASGSAQAGEINGDNAALAGALYGLLTLQEKAYIDFQKS